MAFDPKKLSELDLATSIADNALIYVVQGEESFATTWGLLKTTIQHPAQGFAASLTVSGTSTRNYSQLQFTDIIIVTAANTGLLIFGITLLGDEIMTFPITSGNTYVISLNYFSAAASTLFIQAPSNTIINFYDR